MKVIWSSQAWKTLQGTARYIRNEFGRKKRQAFMDEMRHLEHLLRQQPHLGPMEPLLADSPKAYRSIVATPYNKFIYTITDNTIEIVAVWDTRRAPSALIAETNGLTD